MWLKVDWDVGLGNLRLEVVGTRGRRTQKRWGSGTWDVGTRGRDKQTTPDFCAEFVKDNFWCS